jgi:hypothetical protein
MRQRAWVVGMAVLLTGGLLASGLQTAGAQGRSFECSERTLRGTYGAQMQGIRTLPPAAGGGTESVIGVVIRTYDGEGGFTQIDNIKGSVTGIVPDRPGEGTYAVSPDCRAIAEFIPGPGAPLIQERLVIVQDGAEVRSIVSSPAGVMVTAVAKRIDRR